jgi:dTDP-4-amino-4,6-dideoxygalactose transaminase
MSNVAAAIGRGQLQVLDDRVTRKRELFDAYRNLLGNTPGISFMPEPSWSRSNRWLTVILIDPAKFGTDTHAVRDALAAENVEARPVWKPMHLQKVFRKQDLSSGERGTGSGESKREQDGSERENAEAQRSLSSAFRAPHSDFAVSEELFAKGLCLPSGTAMTEADVERVAGIVKRAGGR